jgi:tripartite ATP-independent transporter DctP family solute receptor
MKSRIIPIAVLIVACVLAAGAACGAAEFRTTMKITSTQGLDHPYMVGAKLFADAVKERSKGRIVIELYPGIPDKTGERELIEAMKKGAFDLVVSSTGPLGAFSPSMNIVDIPYLFRDSAHADAVLDGKIGKALLADMSPDGIKGLAFWENGFRHLTNAKVPARTCGEAGGLKIRVMENKVHISAWKAAGLKPVAMAWGDLHQALVAGEVDGQENPVAVFYSNRFWEVQKFFTLTHHVYSPAPLLMNKERFYGMPLADRLLFMETAMEVAKLQRKGNRDAEEQKLKEIESKGVTVVRDVDRASYERAMAPAIGRWYKKFGKDRIDAIKAVR